MSLCRYNRVRLVVRATALERSASLMEIIVETCAKESSPAGSVCGVEPLAPGILDRHAPSAHFTLQRGNQLAARCSIWSDSTPQYSGHPVGVLGHYAASDAAAGARVIARACDRLKQHGFRQVVGPMDGNTWRRYRLITWRGSEPPFAMEPDNPDDWPGHFQAAGFSPLAHYFSAINRDLSATDPRIPPALLRFESEGIKFRSIDMSRYLEELKAVHELSLEAFSDNFLYTPIAQAEFLAMYAPLQPLLRPEFVLFAEKNSRLIGFIFGIPDFAQSQRQEPVTTVIAKSMAVRPGREGAGLGSVLMDQFHQAAHIAGFTRVIHALMHESNRSRRISSRSGHTIRRYTLFARNLV
jgi:GNAT superfamily N-acetyltransferase